MVLSQVFMEKQIGFPRIAKLKIIMKSGRTEQIPLFMAERLMKSCLNTGPTKP